MDKNTVKDVIDITTNGTGYLCRNYENEVVIRNDRLGTALNGDLVEVSVKEKNGRRYGTVTKVLERAKDEFVGIIEKDNNEYFLVPDNKRVHRDIKIVGDTSKLSSNIKALVKLTRWDNREEDPEGELLRILGQSGVHEVEMQSIILGQGFDLNFPASVEKAADEIKETKEEFFKKEIPKRRDFRDTTTFTIDPYDAKDFDDAISIKKLENGNIEVGVHIADVSAYVAEGDAIDKEAQERGTSIYLVDRTIPMLPEVLSNDVCSLNPNEDKLTFSTIFTLNKGGEIQDKWFGETVINSDRRFSYEEVQKILDEGSGELYEELNIANNISKSLREERMNNGSIDFEQDEVEFELDKDGRPLGVYRKVRTDSHMLIEDLMLLANREVATYVHGLCKEPNKRATFVYRIHDLPDTDKIEELSVFLRAIGQELENNKGVVNNLEIKKLFKAVEGKPEEELIKKATIRSMAKAIYSTKNIGHFGLSFEFYTHFTSPIRRYPDLMVHRLLKRHLGEEKILEKDRIRYEKIAIQSSQREISAVEAERESIKYKQVEYMTQHVGETFDAIVSGVAEWGIFVEEVNTKAEGLVRIGTLGDDYYELDDSGYLLRGKKKKQSYGLGDKVKVKLVEANLEEKQLDFIIT